MPKVKVRLHGKQGQRTAEITPQVFSTRHISTGLPEPSEPAAITPHLQTPVEQIQAVLPAFNTAWKTHRKRLIAYLSQGFRGNISDGVILHEIGTALETTYAPRNAMTAAQWRAFTSDLQAQDFDSVQWIASLQTQIYRKYEDLRPPRPFTEPAGEIKVYLLDGEDGELLIYAYDELPAPRLLDYQWQRYCNLYRCSVEIRISENETLTFTAETEQTEVA